MKRLTVSTSHKLDACGAQAKLKFEEVKKIQCNFPILWNNVLVHIHQSAESCAELSYTKTDRIFTMNSFIELGFETQPQEELFRNGHFAA